MIYTKRIRKTKAKVVKMTRDKRRTFQISSDIFWGYQMTVDLGHFDNIEQIIRLIKMDLKGFLKSRNLLELYAKAEAMNLHLHSPFSTFDEMFEKSLEDDIIYLCDHCGKS